jgi:hypothetical protein
MTKWTVVDLGTKLGGALDVYRSKGYKLYHFPAAAPKTCLGIDRQDRYKKDVEKKGYAFRTADLLDPDFAYPAAQVYLAFDFLEHLPSIIDAQKVLRRMVEASEVGVWLRCPSFENDPRLATAGLRFAWTNWHGHPAHFKIEHAMEAVGWLRQRHGYKLKTKVVENQKITSSTVVSIVPVSAPVDTRKYTQDLGPKKRATFTPPIPGQHEILIWKEK